jgi:hypothetical protein
LGEVLEKVRKKGMEISGEVILRKQREALAKSMFLGVFEDYPGV